ncbi:hypothetical protein F444_01835 [Phytophthora nicotianae P1976]|uniref:Uncharacterized protein n=1 Tax=Phytophthora nicotianae P1976 TaxID=1317066 RepID=A0A081AZD0_PHYNI|nr:hypothetical protein F444_01835 [Phytophthora nicotianae P1976]
MVRLKSVKDEKSQVEQQVCELQEDLESLQAQNSLFSKWMLVRNENTIAAQQDAPQYQEYPQQRDQDPLHPRQWQLRIPSCRPRRVASNLHGGRPNPPQSVRSEHDDDPHYMIPDTSTRSRPGSPRQRSSRKWQSTTRSSHRARHHNMERVKPLSPRSPHDRMQRKTSTTSLSSVCSSATSAAASSSSSDHERLRKLMSRNRELQQRLQQETMATQNLEREITNMTS